MKKREKNRRIERLKVIGKMTRRLMSECEKRSNFGNKSLFRYKLVDTI